MEHKFELSNDDMELVELPEKGTPTRCPPVEPLDEEPTGA